MPARPDEDPDLVIAGAIRGLMDALTTERGSHAAEVERLKAERDAAEQDLADVKTQRDKAFGDLAREFSAHAAQLSAKDAEVARLKEQVEHRDAVLRRHADFGSLFQPGGKYHEEAKLRLGGTAVVDGGCWLDAQLGHARAEISRLKAREREAFKGGRNADQTTDGSWCFDLRFHELPRQHAEDTDEAFAAWLASRQEPPTPLTPRD